MDALKNLSKTLYRAAEVTAKKAGEFTDIAKLKIKETRITSDISDQYEAIGTLIYKQYKESTDESAKIAQLCMGIDALNEQLLAIKAELDSVRASHRSAEETSAANGESTVYEGEMPTEENITEDIVKTTVCTACGAILSEDAQFCYKCGQKQA